MAFPYLIDAVGGAQKYTRVAAVGAGGSDAIIVSGVTTAGTVVLTLKGGGTVTWAVALGSTILPFDATAANLGTAVGGTFQAAYLT